MMLYRRMSRSMPTFRRLLPAAQVVVGPFRVPVRRNANNFYAGIRVVAESKMGALVFALSATRYSQ
jgi:hypothetical protein